MSIVYTPIRFGIENQIPFATLTSTPAPVAATPLDNLKNEHRARVVVFDDPSADVVIEGALTDPNQADFFALPNATMSGLAEVNLELYADALAPVDSLNMGFVPLAELIALGDFRAGIDAWGVPREVDVPEVFVYWFNAPIVYEAFKLTIRHSAFAASLATDVRLRMLLIGQKLEMDYNFSHDGNSITFVTPPELMRTASGSNIQKRGQSKSRDMSLNLDAMSESDRIWLWRLESTLKGRPFIVSAYPNAEPWQFNNFSMLGRFGDALSFSHDAHQTYSTNLRILEV